MDAARSLTFTDLMAKLGYFLFYWSSFEAALTHAIEQACDRLGRDAVALDDSTSERIDMWAKLAVQLPENVAKHDVVHAIQHQAHALRKIRNLIVHGLVGGHAQPASHEPGYIECFDALNGKSARYGIDDLERYTQGADACRRGLLKLDYFNYQIAQSDYE